MADRILETIRPGLSDLYSLTFAGTVATSRVSSGNNAGLNLTTAATLEFWFYSTGSVNQYRQLAGQGSTGNQAFSLGFTNATSKIEVRVGNGTGSVLLFAGTTTILVNTLYHVALTYDVADAGGTARLYVNGIEEANGALTTGISLTADKTFSIGGLKADNTVSRHFIGKIDLVKLYSRACTAAEILAHTTGVFSNNSNLLLSWKCDNGFGAGVADMSGNGNHGLMEDSTSVTWSTRLVDF